MEKYKTGDIAYAPTLNTTVLCLILKDAARPSIIYSWPARGLTMGTLGNPHYKPRFNIAEIFNEIF